MTICEKEAELVIAKGVEVEVTSDELGFKGAWYRATIEETPGRWKRKKVLVKYASLVDDDGATPLTESVDPAFVRPLPPEEIGNAESFEENDVVDAYHRDGWWTGVVRNVRENSRYWVYFDNPPDVIELEKKDLRIHFDWIHGKWIRPDKQIWKRSMFSSGTEVEVKPEGEGLQDLWIPAIVIKENEDGTFYIKYMSSRATDAEATRITVGNRHIRPKYPLFGVGDYDLREGVETVHELGWRQGIITTILAGKRYTVSFMPENEHEEMEFAHSDLRPYLEWIDGNWIDKRHINQMNQEQLASTIKVSDNKERKIEESTPFTRMRKERSYRLASCSESSASSLRKQIKLAASLDDSKQSIHAESTDTGIVSKTQVIVEAGDTMENLNESTPSFGTLDAKRSRKQSRIRSMNTDQKRKRQDSKGSNVRSDDVITEWVGSDGSSEALAGRLKANTRNGVRANKANGKNSTKGTPELIKDQQKSNNDTAGEKRKEIKAPKTGERDGKRKRGRPSKFTSPQLSHTGGQKSSEPKVFSVSDSEKSVAVTPNNVHEDDQPLRTSSLQTPPVQGENDAANRHIDVYVETPANGGDCTLLFTKRSPVWKTLESMKVFEAVPQRPHFRSLLETKEEYREGTAIGLMVTFASVFDRIASLQFDDPASTIDSFTESLLDMEKHGFDVTLPQGRIKELLSIKDKQAQLSGESNNIQREITEQYREKGKYSVALEETRCKMEELQKQYNHVKLLMDNQDNEIANLKLRSDMVNAQVQTQRLEFQKIVNAPWELA